jgi:hypothetical protein
LEQIKARPSFTGGEVSVVRNEHGWLEVRVAGVPIGVQFKALSRYCVC